MGYDIQYQMNIGIYPLAVSHSNCPELADTKGFLFA